MMTSRIQNTKAKLLPKSFQSSSQRDLKLRRIKIYGGESMRNSSSSTTPPTAADPRCPEELQVATPTRTASAKSSPISPVLVHPFAIDDCHHDLCENAPYPEDRCVSSTGDCTIISASNRTNSSRCRTNSLSHIDNSATSTYSEIQKGQIGPEKNPSTDRNMKNHHHHQSQGQGGQGQVSTDPFSSKGSNTTEEDLIGDARDLGSFESSQLTNQRLNLNKIRMITQESNTTTSNTSGANTSISVDPSVKSDLSFSSAQAETTRSTARVDGSSSASIGSQAVGNIGHNPNGQYLLRQDVFLPQLQKAAEPNQDYEQNKLFFQNIDAAFGKCNISIDIVHDKQPIMDANELKNICKMCFGAMCIVFSSHNPSMTKIGSGSKRDRSPDDTLSGSENDSDDSFTKHSKISSVYQNSLEKDISKTAIFMRQQRRLAGDDDISDSLHNIMIGFDHAGGSCGNSNLSGPSNGYTLMDEAVKTNDGVDSPHGFMQRPLVPLAVVYMLWSKLIATHLEERIEGKKNDDFVVNNRIVKEIADRIKDVLVQDMCLLHLSFQESKIGKGACHDADFDNSDKIEANTSSMECLKINHDLHLQYGLHISQNSSLFPFFLKKGPSDQGCQGLKFSYRIFDHNNWNPEHALNFILASSCLKRVHRSRTMEKMGGMVRMQYDYAVEMLPWHLMRSMQYQTVASILSDVSFVKGRLDNLDAADVASMHVADFEELYDSVLGWMIECPSLVADIEVDKAMAECYGMLGSLIRSKDSSRWQCEDKSEDESDIEDDAIDLTCAKSVAKSLETLGDSLFRYKKEAESMKYYYRSLVRYEHINTVERKRLFKAKDTSKIFNEKTQLQLGGVLSRIAAVYECGNEKADAMLCYERALSFYSKCQTKQHTQGVAKTLASMGELHFTLKEYDSSLSCFNEALLMMRSMDENCDEVAANLLLVMGNVRKEMGELNEALELFSEALYNKTLLYGKSHPEVGFIHHIIGIAYCEKPDLQKALAHFQNSLKIRKDSVALVQSYLPPNDKSGRIQSRELEVTESLEVMGKVYETLCDLGASFIYYEESSTIHYSHLLDLASGDACAMMISDIVAVLQSEPEFGTFIEDIYNHLQTTLRIGLRLCPIGRIFKTKLSFEDLTEIEGQMADIMLHMGNIRGAKFLEEMSELEIEYDNVCAKDVSKERRLATEHLENSVTLRKRRIERLGNNEGEKAREILQDSVSMSETLAYAHEDEDPFISRLHLTPSIYEEMLQTMAVLYRKLGEYDKSVKCYNEVSLLLTRMALDEKTNISQKDKVAFSSQSIGDILFDTGEFPRALESYAESLQLLEASGADSLVLAHTLNKEGSTLLKLKKWGEATLSFNKALCIRVDRLPKDHIDIAESFHFIGKAYEGDSKSDQALDYYKKAQKIISGRLVDTDTPAADLYYDLGSIVLLQDEDAFHYTRSNPPDEDISLALTCLALSRDIYIRNFGDDALEVGNALSLLGVIYHQYGEVPKAITSFKRALTIFKGAPLDQNARIRKTLVKLGLATLDISSDDNEEVFDCYSLAQDMYEEREDCKSMEYADLFVFIGEAHLKFEDNDKAMEYFQDSLAIYHSVLGEKHAIGSKILTRIGECFIRKRKHKDALVLLEEALQIHIDAGNDFSDLGLAEIQFNLGIVYCETGNLDEAMNSYEKSLKIRTKYLGENSVETAQVLNNIGSVFARNKEYQRALEPWQDAIEIYRSLGVNEEDPKVACTRGNIEISRNLKQMPIEKNLRKIGEY
eukprot:scaffold1744_cov237-Chaetoceros_neogracile.AAC.7